MAIARKITWLGLWRSEYSDADAPDKWAESLPMPLELEPGLWNLDTKSRVMEYLRAAPIFQQTLGENAEDLGLVPPPPVDHSNRTDGKWAWPGNLWYLVRELDLPLPEEFVADMAARDFVPPARLEDLGLLGIGFDQDLEYWPNWAFKHLRGK